MWTNRIIKREAVVKTRYTRDLESTTLIDRLFIGMRLKYLFIYLCMIQRRIFMCYALSHKCHKVSNIVRYNMWNVCGSQLRLVETKRVVWQRNSGLRMYADNFQTKHHKYQSQYNYIVTYKHTYIDTYICIHLNIYKQKHTYVLENYAKIDLMAEKFAILHN